MAEDENVGSMPMNEELAERLGVASTVDTSPKQSGRSGSGSDRASNPDDDSSVSSCAPGCRNHHRHPAVRDGRIIPELEPFIHLLPIEDVASKTPEEQQFLYRLVFEAGVKAYQHLLQYVLAVGTGSSSSSVSSNDTLRMFDARSTQRESPAVSESPSEIPLISRLQSIDSDAENLTMIDRIDHAYETMIEVGGEISNPAVAGTPEMSPQMLANTLGLFAGAALRRPPTRAVECVMAAAQDSNGAHSDVDRHDMYEHPAAAVDPYSPCEDGLLVLACAAGFTELVREILILREATIFSSETMDVTPLMEAAAAGTTPVVECLISMAADVNSVSSTNNTPLIYAAAAGQVECVRLLLATGECDVHVRNESGHCALMEAASSGSVEIVKMLIDAGAKPTFVSMHSEFKESPLTLAAYKGHLKVVTFLLCLRDSEGENYDFSEEELHTALMEASMDGHIDVARVLLNAGALVNMDSESFESPLTLACCGGHDTLAKMLLDAGAYIEEPNDESYTPLMEAAREGHVNVVKVLLEHGAQVNAQTEETGETAMTVAACGGYTECLEMLVRHGGDLELGGNTPLMEAAQEGHAQTVMFIVSASNTSPSRSPNFRSHATTSLCLAAENGHQDVVEILYTAGAELNCEVDGRTPLMKAAKNGCTEIVSFLLSKNADVNRRSSTNDATALSLACASGHKDIVQLLLLAGSDPNVELKDGISCVLEAARTGFVDVVELLLDHNGVGPYIPQGPPGAPKVPATSANGQPKCIATRRKKPATPSTPTKAYTGVPPDPNINGPPMYSPQIVNPAPIPQAGNIANSEDDAREYYKFLANIFNLRATKNSSLIPVPTDLPADVPHKEILNDIERLQKMIASLPPNAEILRAEIMNSSSDSYAKRAEAVIKSNKHAGANTAAAQAAQCNAAPSSNPSQPAQNGPSEVSAPDPPANSAKFLASVYEHGKKNFSGLPLPLHSVFQQYLAAAAASSVASTSASATAQSFSAALASTTLQNMSLEQINEIMSFFKGNSTADDLFHGANSAQSPEKRTTKKKLVDMFNALEAECRKHYAEGRFTELAGNAVLEQQTAALNETLKVLRPTVTSLPGGVVASANSPSNLPPVNYTPGTNTGHAHRRTHSEGDESDIRAPLPSGKVASFNVDKATESNNDTPLTLACSNGHKDMVSVLVSRGANIEHRDKKGFTPLILAATGGHVGVVEALLTAGANIEAQSERTKDTALSLACSGGRKEVVELLLNKGANKEHRNVSDYTPLSLAASGGYVDIVNMLLNAGAEINSRTGSKLGISPLMLAAMNGHKDATRVLLEKGSDINAQIETNRNTALTLACFQGRTDVVRLLLHYNANVEHRAKTGLTPLMEAANGGYVEVGELLLEYAADPNTTPVPSSRDTALTIAADKGHEKFVEMLLNRGAIIDARNKKGCTALWLACHGGHLDTVQVLVKYVADVDAQDNRKVSPLMIAFRKGFSKIVSYLVNHVKQYPSDQEMERYMATLSTTDCGKTTKEVQDLVKNCTESMNVIKKAKTAQAEEANKAAEKLLALLAEEEEQERSKKQKRAKKREEKKAKKASKKGEEKAKSPSESAQAVSEPPKEHPTEESEDESESVVVSHDEKIVEQRVPQVIPQMAPQLENREQAATNRKKEKMPSGRRGRNEVSKVIPNGNGLSTAPISKAPSVLSPTSPVAPSKPTQNEEWVKASKNKKSQPKTRTPVVVQTAQKDFYSDESGAFGGWKDVELSRRRSNTLVVCNTVIARVIGRGGANINAIREATGASIEVEKQGSRRDQHERQICIRGTSETVKNATLMINGLIADNEVTVNDVIRQVLRGNTSVASSSSESGGRVAPFENKTPPTPSMATATTVKSAVSSPAAPPATTNVWQQRMAARQQQMQMAAAKDSVPAVPEAPPVRNPSPVKHVEEVVPEPVVASPPAPVAAPSPPAVSYASEVELRKAPGYRPQNIQAPQTSDLATSSPTNTSNAPVPPASVEKVLQPTESELRVEDSPLTRPSVSSLQEENSAMTDLGNLSLLENPDIAQIWKGDGSSTNEPAWGNNFLLSTFNALSLCPQEWSSGLTSSDFATSSTSSNSAPRMAVTSSSSYDWMASGSSNMSSAPLYSRPSTVPRSAAPPSSVAARPENNALFNQLAAQLLNQGNGAPASQAHNNYYPPNTYADSSSSMLSNPQGSSAAQKSYAQVYQSANQEYENLNNILSTYNSTPHYSSSNGDFSTTGYPSSPSTVRTVPSRIPSSYAPPPGFGNVPPAGPPMNANTTVPPPHIRHYYPGQVPPMSQNSSAFSVYNQQQQQPGSWSKLNGGPPGGSSSWNAGGWS